MNVDRWSGTLIGSWVRLPVALRLCVPFAIMSVLWWLSSRIPSDRSPSQLRAALHNGAHIVAYGALAGSWLLALVRSSATAPRVAKATIWSFALAVGYGVVDELHQSSVPARVCSFADLMTDAAGAGLALLVLRSWVGGGSVRWPRVLLMATICLGCVAFATWGPW